MISEATIKSIVEEVLHSMGRQDAAASGAPAASIVNEEQLTDLAAVDLRSTLMTPSPHNAEAYLRLKARTPARLGIWRCGPRPLTRALLRFRADHAVARDAVFSSVSEPFLEAWGLPVIQTRCRDKDQFLTRPDLGRQLDEENIAALRSHCPTKAPVQIVIADGLSSTAVETNARDACEALMQGLRAHRIEPGKPIFLKYGRVPAMDCISEALQPEVTVMLIGERPGLATGESLSCYMAYHSSAAMPESNRTVLSNIHKGGTAAVEAGAHIADLVKKMIEQKASGLNLKL